jgi:hypothetical protein
LIPYISA